MQSDNKNHGGGFMHGFLLGAIVGAAVVFFLFTEKGKRLLRTITEEGLEGAGELRDLLSEEMDEYEEELDEPAYTRTEEKPQPVRTVETNESPVATHTSSRPKRFFRGVKRG